LLRAMLTGMVSITILYTTKTSLSSVAKARF
jgi:hypothetical protein